MLRIQWKWLFQKWQSSFCARKGEVVRRRALIFHLVLPGLASLTAPAWLLCINRLSEGETSGGSESTGSHLVLHVNKDLLPAEKTISRCNIHKQWAHKSHLLGAGRMRRHWKCLFLQGELYFSSLLFWHSDKDSLRIKELEVKQQNMLDMHYSSLLKSMSHEGLRSMWITEILSKISITLRIMWDLYFSCFVCAQKHITCSSKITQLSVWDPVTDKDIVYGPVCGE